MIRNEVVDNINKTSRKVRKVARKVSRKVVNASTIS